MAGLRLWLLSRQCQLTAQLSVSVLITSLFTLWRPLFFPHACLVPIFVVVIIGSLAQDQHIGTRLQVSAWVLGPTWVAALLAGVMMTLAKVAAGDHSLAHHAAGYVAATAILAVLGLSLLVFLQAVAPPGPARVMGLIAVLLYGIMAILSLLYPSPGSMWVGAVLLVVLGTCVAALVGLLVGWLVLPSLASDEVWRLTSEALQGAGAVLSYHTSLLMVDPPTSTSSRAGAASDGAAATTPPAAAAPASAESMAHNGWAWQHQQGVQEQPRQGTQEAAATALERTPPARPHPEALPQHHRQVQSTHGSIDIAAAGSAVAAAAEALARRGSIDGTAAGTLSWMDVADEAVSAADLADNSRFDAGSSHSSGSGDSTASILGSDAVADAAAEFSRRLGTAQGAVNETAAAAAAAAHLSSPQLSEQLLQELGSHEQVESTTHIETNPVATWVMAASAATISRRGSLVPRSTRVSEDGSACTDYSDLLLGAQQQHQHAGTQRNSLEGAASLDFMEEMDDQAFIHMMRVLSQSKGGRSMSSAQPPAADAAARLSASSSKAPAAAAGGTGRGVGMFRSKSAASVLSAVSVAGSAAPADDWVRAVAPVGHGQQGNAEQCSSAAGIKQQHQQQQHYDVEPGHLPVPGLAFQVAPRAASVAGSVVSSHASVLQHPNGRHLQQHQHSRLGLVRTTADGQPRHPLQQHPGPHTPAAGGVEQPSGGIRAWLPTVLRPGWFRRELHPPDDPQALPLEVPVPNGSSGMPALSKEVQLAAGGLDAKHVGQGTGGGHVPAAKPQLLPPPTSSAQLQPLVARAKAALASARLEPSWLRPRGVRQFDVDACAKLLDDVELLLVRLSTLEGVSEERSLMGLQLHELAHYRGIADALALIYAQLTAFISHVAAAAAQQETCRHQPQPRLLSRLWRGAAAGGAAAAAQQPPSHPAGVQAASRKMVLPAGVAAAGGTQRPSPFAGAAGADGGAGGWAEGDAASVGVSALLSGMERQGSLVSSYLWEKKTGWKTARELLKREMDASLGSYWWSVRKASKKLPVKVPRSREVMILIFLWPICNGVLEACERIEASAQQALKQKPASKQTRQQQQQKGPGAPGSLWHSTRAAWQKLLSVAPWRQVSSGAPATSIKKPQPPQMQCKSVQGAALNGAPAGQTAAAACVSAAVSRAAARVWHWSGGAALVRWLQRQAQWAGPLLQLVLVTPSLQAVREALVHQLPASLSSKQGVKDMLQSRNFQAGVKLLAATSCALLLTLLLMAYVPQVAHSVPIFGYAAVVLCMQPRVEATVDQAARRVLGTILGACLGLAATSIPDIYHQPFLLLACLGVASVALGVLARPQRRTAIVLALLTLCAVALCGYEAACCSASPGLSTVDRFLARMGSVVGGCIFVAVLNRALLPWYTSDYALEQLADALEQAAQLFDQIYHSQLERMRLSELVAGQISQEGPEVLSVQVVNHSTAAPAPAPAPAGPDTAAGSPVLSCSPATWTATAAPELAAAGGCEEVGSAGGGAGDACVPPAAQLAACEAAEAQLLVVLRQQVLARLVAVQLSLAKESVSWQRGVLATPPMVLNVLGAMNAVKEALTSQRLALAPFTRHGAEQQQQPALAAARASGGAAGMLHMMVHCYSLWALPLHPLWLQILAAVHELSAVTAAHLRRRPQGASATAAARAELMAKLEQLELRRLELRHGWLDIRVGLHRVVRGAGAMPQAAAAAGDGLQQRSSFWPTDSVHLFTFTYGVSRCLNAFAATAQAVVASLEG